jgi:hypothetical protein
MITLSNVPWIILALVLAGDAIAMIQEWLKDRYELTWTGTERLKRPGIERRWYGTNARVRRSLGVYQVIQWSEESTEVPWLLVQDADGEAACWAPVTDFAPHEVRRFPFGYRPVVRAEG